MYEHKTYTLDGFDPNKFLKSINLKLISSILPPCGNEYIDTIQKLDTHNIHIPEENDTKYESDIIGTIGNSIKVVLYRPMYSVKEDDSLEAILFKYAAICWHNAFIDSLDCIRRIDKKISNTAGRVVPNREDIFQCFNCNINDVKVVIIGQDPYYNVIEGNPVAVGYSFSTRRGNNVPASLRNIYTEINKDYPEFEIPHHGDLTNWVKEGVLLLNSSLTTLQGYPNSHAGLWDEFIYQVLRLLSSRHKHIIFLLWGNNSQKLVKSILSANRHYFLESSHPSPMSYKYKWNSFEGCEHFKQTNELLLKIGKSPINWNSINES